MNQRSAIDWDAGKVEVVAAEDGTFVVTVGGVAANRWPSRKMADRNAASIADWQERAGMFRGCAVKFREVKEPGDESLLFVVVELLGDRVRVVPAEPLPGGMLPTFVYPVSELVRVEV